MPFQRISSCTVKLVGYYYNIKNTTRSLDNRTL